MADAATDERQSVADLVRRLHSATLRAWFPDGLRTPRNDPIRTDTVEL